MSDDTTVEPTKVAIACQGGGSHTAFTAGVLQELLAECDWDEEYELVGISGTSGGAFNALATWYGLLTGDEEKARRLLRDIWDDLAANDPSDRMLNSFVRTMNKLGDSGAPMPRFSPYQIPGEELGKERIRDVLETHIDFEEIAELCTYDAPELVVGTVDVNAGEFETFTNEDVTPKAILASAAIPNIFQAVEINDHYHWDGLFSQNPPVSDLMYTPPDRKPEELWIIQINAQTYEGEPTTLEEIADRRNELSGNISMNQEVSFIEQVNEWVENGRLPEAEFSTTEIHRICMDKRFGASSKADRDPAFISELMERGHERAEGFLDGH